MRRLMAILAHPDDEALGFGSTLARYAAEGAEVALVTATRGERGWVGPPDANPGMAALGRTREQELRCAAGALGVRDLTILDYVDGDLDVAEPQPLIAALVHEIRRVRPQVILTFGPDGGYGHPDHIAISQAATAAAVCAADPAFADPGGLPPHRVAKLYYRVWSMDDLVAYERVFGHLAMQIDGVERSGHGWPAWNVTTSLDARAYWRAAWAAVRCHATQVGAIEGLFRLSDAEHARIWGVQNYYRAFSTANGGRQREDDLFAGIDGADAA
jgi:LmbE family N-acetylglucosaminyl deacetylase